LNRDTGAKEIPIDNSLQHAETVRRNAEGGAIAAAITLDTDWAPDFVIDEIAARLARREVRATWFVTHPSPAIERLRRRPDLFELGIHPNFLSGSTQGASSLDVLRNCLETVPGATSMRTHALVQSTPLLDMVMKQSSIATDVSLFLPHMEGVRPIEYWWQGRMLLRVPYVWEDDFEMECPRPAWSVAAMLETPGVKIFDFHPIHVYLNSGDLNAYNTLKQRAPRLQGARPDQAADLIATGSGAGSAFDELLHALAAAGSRCISDFRVEYELGGRSR